MTTWTDGENGRRTIVLDSAGSERSVPFRHAVSIAKQPTGDVEPAWDVFLDGLRLFSVRAPDTSEAEAAALGQLNTWAYELMDQIYLVTHPKEPLPPVRCVWCDYVGHSIVPEGVGDGRQGDNVASSVSRGNGSTTPNGFTYDVNMWFVFGGYGSSDFDLKLFRFVKNNPTDPADPVCDGCIQKRINAGDLELLSEQFIAEPPVVVP